MIKRVAVATMSMVALASVAFAHVSVLPRQSPPGATERYTVRVPTERNVSTTSVEMEIPDGVTVLDVSHPATGTHDVKRAGDRIVAIVWTTEIKARERAEFTFNARNPNEGAEIVWKVHQRYADGTASDWVGPAGSRQPAPMTKLAAQAAGSAAAVPSQTADTSAIVAWLQGYDAAFVAKDLEKLATFYHPDVTIYEGGGINRGWIDYRDRHLGPELKAFENLQFSHSNIVVRALGPDAAYVTSEYAIKAKMPTRDVDSGGLETLVLVRQDGVWKIRHSHTSSRPRRPAGGALSSR